MPASREINGVEEEDILAPLLCEILLEISRSLSDFLTRTRERERETERDRDRERERERERESNVREPVPYIATERERGREGGRERENVRDPIPYIATHTHIQDRRWTPPSWTLFPNEKSLSFFLSLSLGPWLK